MMKGLLRALGIAAAIAGAQLAASVPVAALPTAGQLACAAADCAHLGEYGLVEKVARRVGSGSYMRPRVYGGGQMRFRGGSYVRPRVYSGGQARFRGYSHRPRYSGYVGRRGHYGHGKHGHGYNKYYGHKKYARRYYNYLSPFYYPAFYYPYPSPYGLWYDDYYDYGYYGNGYDADAYVAAPVVLSEQAILYCKRKYRSFNPRTGLYRNKYGRYKKCIYRQG